MFSQASEAWECDRLSKQPDRDAMEFVLGQTRRRALLFLFYLDTSAPRFSAALFVLLSSQFRPGTLFSLAIHPFVSRSASILASSNYFEETTIVLLILQDLALSGKSPLVGSMLAFA